MVVHTCTDRFDQGEITVSSLATQDGDLLYVAERWRFGRLVVRGQECESIKDAILSVESDLP